jgi:fucose permease
MGVTALGLLVPFFLYSFTFVLIGFALLGIGNTIVQVSANPLLVEVAPANRASSFLSFSQFVKAVGSMIGAPLAGLLAAQFGDWKLLFLVFGLVSILSVVWLGSVNIESKTSASVKATFTSVFSLLGNSFILLMVISIFVVVGIDVGFNSNSGQFLIKHFGIEPLAAEKGRSIYFLGRTIGTFTGAILLTRITSRRFFLWTSVMGLAFLSLILIVKSAPLAWIFVFLIGLTVANIWPLVFSIAVEKYPDRNNEISGLMMMAISGGAVVPLLVGWLSDISSIVTGMSVLVACMIYLLLVSIYCLKR